MEWLKAFQGRHTSGYVHAGICLSCRRGESGCKSGRSRNSCPYYMDNTPTKEEHLEQYASLVKSMFAAEGEPARGDLYGAAQSKRKLMCGFLGITEEEIRTVEDAEFTYNELNERDLRRLRWEL